MPRKPLRQKNPGRKALYQERRRRALEVAARAFNERGFYRTSLDDVAAELDVTKAALYYYFESKDEILYECHAAAIQQITDVPLDDFGGSQRTGLEKIEEFVRRYVAMIVQSFGRCLVLVGTQPLEPANATKCRKGRRGIHELLCSLIREGIDDGSVVPCDPEITASFVFGALNWIATWYSEKGRIDLGALTEMAVTYVGRAITASGGAVPSRTRRSSRRSSVRLRSS